MLSESPACTRMIRDLVIIKESDMDQEDHHQGKCELFPVGKINHCWNSLIKIKFFPTKKLEKEQREDILLLERNQFRNERKVGRERIRLCSCMAGLKIGHTEALKAELTSD